MNPELKMLLEYYGVQEQQVSGAVKDLEGEIDLILFANLNFTEYLLIRQALNRMSIRIERACPNVVEINKQLEERRQQAINEVRESEIRKSASKVSNSFQVAPSTFFKKRVE